MSVHTDAIDQVPGAGVGPNDTPGRIQYARTFSK